MIENYRKASFSREKKKLSQAKEQIDVTLSVHNYNPCVTFDIDDINRFRTWKKDQ